MSSLAFSPSSLMSVRLAFKNAQFSAVVGLGLCFKSILSFILQNKPTGATSEFARLSFFSTLLCERSE